MSAVPFHRLPASARRIAAVLQVLLLCAVALLLAPSPAHAHGRGSDATNMSSVILDTPDLPGITWTIYGGDEILEVVNTTDIEVTILGYQTEPYLRVGPDGVWENRNSEATYINQERQGLVEVPPTVDPNADPDWVQISSGNSTTWHDHRMHYMGAGLPAAVTDPALETLIIEAWEVPFLHGDQELAITGDLTWIPGPSPVPWLLIGLLMTLPALIGLRTVPETDPAGEDPKQPVRWSGLARPAAVVLGVIVLLNVTHLIDDLFAVPLPAVVRAVAAGQTVLFLAIGAFGAVRAWQGGEGAFTALGVGSGAVLVGQGLLYWSVLGVSQIASLFPDAMARVTVGLSVAQAIPIGIVAVIGTRRLLPPLLDELGEPEPSDAPA